MDSKVQISNDALRHLIREIDTRPVPAHLRRAAPELLAAHLRRTPSSNLRRRLAIH